MAPIEYPAVSSSHTPSLEMVDFQQTSMWPATTHALMRTDKRREILQPTKELERILRKENTFADPEKFQDLLRFSQPGVMHQDSLARLWENKQANAISLLREEIDTLKQKRIEAEKEKQEVLEELTAQPLYTVLDGDEEMLDPVSIGEGFLCDDGASSWHSVSYSMGSLSESEGDSAREYWREKARFLNQLLSESIKREEVMLKKIEEISAADLPSRLSSELNQQFEQFDNFLRFALRRAPIIIGHQDIELRYVFVHNAFPTLTEEEVLGKTDEEIYQGMGVKELMAFKREVIQTCLPDKREIKFETKLFGVKTFLIAVEPVMNTKNECIGVNFVAMDVTLQVARREKLDRLREEERVQVAMESELNKTIHITEETMRAKQLLATMSHEIRSPLSGVVGMASVLARTALDEEQKPIVEFMVQSGELVLQLINDILDLSKSEAGAMTFEEKKFRPREVVKHVLQLASISSAADKKKIYLESNVSSDVPLEAIGDVLRIRQVLTNLVSNAVKFTHKGKVSVYVNLGTSSSTGHDHREVKQSCENSKTDSSVCPLRPSSHSPQGNGSAQPISVQFMNQHPSLASISPENRLCTCHNCKVKEAVPKCGVKQQRGDQHGVHPLPRSKPVDSGAFENMKNIGDQTIWLHCDIIDTGIGIAESAIPTLFQRYAQASTAHARMYGGTGLGLAICKQLVELMGGTISVFSIENEGSTFSFELPLRAVKETESTGICDDVLNCDISDEVESVLDQSHDSQGSLRLGSISATPAHFPQYSAPKHQGRRHMKATQSSKARTSSQLGSDVGKPFIALPSHKRELLFTPSNELENVSTEATKLKQSKEHANCGGCDNIGRTNNSGDFVVKDLSHHREGFNGENLLLSKYQTPGILMNRMHGKLSQRCSPRSPPGQGHVRKIGKIEDDRMGTHTPSAMTMEDVKQSRPRKILLAEDNQVNVKVTTQMMSSLGHELEVVSNGAEAIQALQQRSYDLVLMDVYMPEMDGLEATRLIRRFEETGSWATNDEGGGSPQGSAAAASSCPHDASPPRRNRLPIIAMTANALEENIRDCHENGMDSFIAKPVSLDKLEEVLNQWLPRVKHQL